MRDNLHTAAGLANNLPGLLLEAEKIAQSFMRGVHGRRRTGQGEAFWQFRPYQQGDASRDIDWRQTAKRDAPFVRQLEWEASQTLWLYRDASDAMQYKSDIAAYAKKDLAEILLLALGMVALNGGEQVALLGTALAPQSHHNAVQRLQEYLPQQAKLTEAARPVSAKSQAVLFSDFYAPLQELEHFCGSLAQRGVSGMLVQICDPAEESLPFSGRIRFQDTGMDGEVLTIPQVDAVRAEYLEKFAKHRQNIADIAARCGWQFMHANTADAPQGILTRLYDGLMMKGAF